MASTIGSALPGKAREYAQQRLLQAVQENMAHGPSALDTVDKNIRDLQLDVHKYHASIVAATEAMPRVRVTNFDYLTTCHKVIARSEIGTVQQIIEQVRRLSDVSAELEARAIQRNRNIQQQLRQALDEESRILAQSEQANHSVDRQETLASIIRRYIRQLDMYRDIEFKIDARGDTLQQICADMIARLTNIKDTLRENQSDYAYFLNDCMQWQLSRTSEGFQ